MGRWGYQPKDSIAALVAFDLVDDVVADACLAMYGLRRHSMRKVWARLTALARARRGRHWDRNWNLDRAGAVQLLLECGFQLPAEVVAAAIHDLEFVLADDVLMRDFRRPGAAKRGITKILEALRDLQVSGHAWRGWPGKCRGSWTGLSEKITRGLRARKRRRTPA